MASKYYGVNVGGMNNPDVTVGASTGSKDIELVVVDTNVPVAGPASKLAILTALDAIRQAVEMRAY